MASLVHNIGLVVSHSGHHKHSAYLVRNSSQLTGFSERELELVALIARYHRKSRPSAKHPEFAVLDADDQRLVRLLAGMLRVAIGLDRRHNARVSGVAVSQVDPDRLVIEALVDCESEVELEVHSANARAGLLADALGIELEVTTSNGVRDREATA